MTNAAGSVPSATPSWTRLTGRVARPLSGESASPMMPPSEVTIGEAAPPSACAAARTRVLCLAIRSSIIARSEVPVGAALIAPLLAGAAKQGQGRPLRNGSDRVCRPPGLLGGGEKGVEPLGRDRGQDLIVVAAGDEAVEQGGLGRERRPRRWRERDFVGPRERRRRQP